MKDGHEAEPRAAAHGVAGAGAGQEQSAAAREPERAEHVRRLVDPGDQEAAGVGRRVEEEPDRDLVEALRRRRPGLAAPLDRPALEAAAREHRPALRLAPRAVVAGQELVASGL